MCPLCPRKRLRGVIMAFLHTHTITAKKNGKCNAYACQHKRIQKGDKIVWTVSTYRGRTLSTVWHPQCHKRATAFAPYWHRLHAISNGLDILPLPLEAYCPSTGRVLKR